MLLKNIALICIVVVRCSDCVQQVRGTNAEEIVEEIVDEIVDEIADAWNKFQVRIKIKLIYKF